MYVYFLCLLFSLRQQSYQKDMQEHQRQEYQVVRPHHYQDSVLGVKLSVQYKHSQIATRLFSWSVSLKHRREVWRLAQVLHVLPAKLATYIGARDSGPIYSVVSILHNLIKDVRLVPSTATLTVFSENCIECLINLDGAAPYPTAGLCLSLDDSILQLSAKCIDLVADSAIDYCLCKDKIEGLICYADLLREACEVYSLCSYPMLVAIHQFRMPSQEVVERYCRRITSTLIDKRCLLRKEAYRLMQFAQEWRLD